MYQSSTLYEYLFTIAGRPYCFHSYVPPPAGRLSPERGADLAAYGRRLRPTDLRNRLRLPELLRVIRHYLDVAAN